MKSLARTIFISGTITSLLLTFTTPTAFAWYMPCYSEFITMSQARETQRTRFRIFRESVNSLGPLLTLRNTARGFLNTFLEQARVAADPITGNLTNYRDAMMFAGMARALLADREALIEGQEVQIRDANTAYNDAFTAYSTAMAAFRTCWGS